ncbi:OmpP1/FadL family transporter [Polyangium jinanense]|uniref:OmpP1/FadL family transporter n=1 Tax=Polyangium jinanense TaxID=2829994 RepID=UPI002340653B|nr:outer membrane protein transport protein [Polyangium jinanense]
MSRRPLRIASLPLVLGSLVASQSASASGLDAPLVGSGQSGPTISDGAAIHWNPAALADIERPELFGGAGLVAGRVGYRRERRGVYQTPDSLRLRGPMATGETDPGKRGFSEEVAATPLAPTGDLFFALPMAQRRLVLGLGAYVPYAAALDFPANGPQAWQLQQAFIVASYVTASAALRVLPNLSFGAGVSYVGGLASLRKKQDLAELPEIQHAFSNPPIGQPNEFGPNAPSHVRELDVLSRPFSLTNALSHGVSFNVGVLYQPSADVRLALAYQHGAQMRYRGRFALDKNDPFFTQDLAAQGLRYPPLVEGDAELAFRLPKRITAGASYQATSAFRVDGFVQYVTYSDVDAFVVTSRSPSLAQPKLGIGPSVRAILPRKWNDTVWVEANGRFAISRLFTMSATVGYQSPASPDETIDVGSPDGHRFIGGLGAVVRATQWLDLHADARAQGILPRTVTTSRSDVANGRYTMAIGYLGGHAKARF